MKQPNLHKYPLIWRKDDFFIKIYCSIPNVATGILLTTSKNAFIIDPGDGILRDLNQDVGPEIILLVSDIFISHGHHDHVGGVWSLLTYLSVLRRKSPLSIYFPQGCVEIVSIYNAFRKVYGKELSYSIILKPVTSEKSFVKNSMKIKPFSVNHRELSPDGVTSIRIPSLGFKFTYDGKSICYGGDTAYSENLAKNARFSDLAIIEAGAKDELSSELHMTVEQASKIGLTAKEYFLVHVPD
jgi:ribonuclease Z